MPTKEYEHEPFSPSPPSLHGPAAHPGRLRRRQPQDRQRPPAALPMHPRCRRPSSIPMPSGQVPATWVPPVYDREGTIVRPRDPSVEWDFEDYQHAPWLAGSSRSAPACSATARIVGRTGRKSGLAAVPFTLQSGWRRRRRSMLSAAECEGAAGSRSSCA